MSTGALRLRASVGRELLVGRIAARLGARDPRTERALVYRVEVESDQLEVRALNSRGQDRVKIRRSR